LAGHSCFVLNPCDEFFQQTIQHLRNELLAAEAAFGSVLEQEPKRSSRDSSKNATDEDHGESGKASRCNIGVPEVSFHAECT